MESFVVLYRLGSEISSGNFKRKLEKEFPNFEISRVNNIEYFAFPAKNLPQVEDRINVILDAIDLGDNDYIAVYYDKKQDPELIKRLMVFGTAQLIENDIQNTGGVHQRVLTDLLESNMLKKS